MRAIDNATITSGVKSGWELMSAAAKGAAEELIRFTARTHTALPGNFHILAGHGNNGGDGFAMAAFLKKLSPDSAITIHAACQENALSGDALTARRSVPEDIPVTGNFSLRDIGENPVLIDAMLGTGVHGNLREPFRSWVSLVNSARCPVFAIDLPSGLNADDGSVPPEGAVIADVTVTFGAPKTGMLSGAGPRYCGKIIVKDIGIPSFIMDRFSEFENVTALADVRNMAHRLPADTYKNIRGHVLVIGGSASYPSAPFLTAEAALRTGAGIVSVLLPASTPILCSVPKALIIRRADDSGKGFFTPASLTDAGCLLASADALAIGPGMSREENCAEFLNALMELAKDIPAILDADALNLIAEHPAILAKIRKNTILTPHAGETRRLLNTFAPDWNNHPQSPARIAEKMAAITRCCFVMKAPRTAVASPDSRKASINLSGSTALATAGSGDVLTGIIAAALAGKMNPFNAAQYGVFLHGLAGELAPRVAGNSTPSASFATGIIADDLLRAIPAALREIQPF